MCEHVVDIYYAAAALFLAGAALLAGCISSLNRHKLELLVSERCSFARACECRAVENLTRGTVSPTRLTMREPVRAPADEMNVTKIAHYPRALTGKICAKSLHRPDAREHGGISAHTRALVLTIAHNTTCYTQQIDNV